MTSEPTQPTPTPTGIALYTDERGRPLLCPRCMSQDEVTVEPYDDGQPLVECCDCGTELALDNVVWLAPLDENPNFRIKSRGYPIKCAYRPTVVQLRATAPVPGGNR